MSALAGKLVLLVENDFIVAAMREDVLVGLGAVVVGPAYRLGEGLRLAEEDAIDVAILDVNIEGERSDAIADALAARNIPFVLATGYGDGEARHGAPVLTKPYTPQNAGSGAHPRRGRRVAGQRQAADARAPKGVAVSFSCHGSFNISPHAASHGRLTAVGPWGKTRAASGS